MSQSPTKDGPAATNDTPAISTVEKPKIVHTRSSRAVWIVVVVVLLIVGVAVGAGYELKWFGGSAPTPLGSCPSDQTLEGAGAALAGALETTWATEYDTPNAGPTSVTYNPAGSGTGISDLTDKTVDFAVTDDPLTIAQVRAMPGPILTLPTSAGAVNIIYNLPTVTQPLHLSGPLLAAIYLGEITTWNNSQIENANPGVSLPSATILTVHRSDAAGTTFVLTSLLAQDNSTWKAGPGVGISISWPKVTDGVAEKGDSTLVSYVAANVDTIGYGALTDVEDASPAPASADILNPSGTYVAPTLGSATNAVDTASNTTAFPVSSDYSAWANVTLVNAHGTGAYPLATLVYTFVFAELDQGFSPSAAKAEVLANYLEWQISPTGGQSYSAGNYDVALPSALTTTDRAGIGSLTYDGAAIPQCA